MVATVRLYHIGYKEDNLSLLNSVFPHILTSCVNISVVIICNVRQEECKTSQNSRERTCVMFVYNVCMCIQLYHAMTSFCIRLADQGTRFQSPSVHSQSISTKLRTRIGDKKKAGQLGQNGSIVERRFRVVIGAVVSLADC